MKAAAGDEGRGEGDDEREVRYLRSPRAIRERCEALYALAAKGALEHWGLDLDRLSAVAERVVQTTRATYPDVRAIPYHSRWRQFAAGGVDRVRRLEDRLLGAAPDERLATHFDLVIASVLLDAGAGPSWSYREPGGDRYTRSEGLAVASHDMFVAGGFSSDPVRRPLRCDGEALERVERDALAAAFQVDDRNPLVGLDERAAVLRRLGQVVRATPAYFGSCDGTQPPRLGHLSTCLRTASPLRASAVLGVVLDALGPIWPGREACGGKNLGDVWTHSVVGRVPFHKLSQWLAYSLCEPLGWAGVHIVGLDELTGLAEYRNGGLFVDCGVIVPKYPEVLRAEHDVSSDVVIEWRALTVALLDRTADRVRALLGLSADEFPLAKVLEGGTWRAGRELAAERRPGGGPPLRIRSDGTVF